MLDLSSAAIVEKNKLSSDGAWLVLLEIDIAGLEQPIRLVRNNENISWGGHEWYAFPFDLDEIGENSKGEIPNLAIRVSNITRVIQGVVEKSGGGVGSTLTIRVVHSKHLDAVEPELQEEFSALSTSCGEQWVSFNLGPAYPVMSRRPVYRYLKNHCQFIYGSAECGVPVDTMQKYTKCNKTLPDCRQRGNSIRYGGEPTIPGGFYV